MTILMKNLSNPEVHRDIKPQVLSVFGDVSLSIGSAFTAYLNPVLEVLDQVTNISTVHVDENDFEMRDYQRALRESVLEAYTGIVQGLKGPEKTPNQDIMLLQNSVPKIFNFIVSVAKDPELSESMMTSLSLIHI